MTDTMSEGGAGGSARVTVIVLSWNGREDTLACLESLGTVDYSNWEVIVVDNDSQDDSVEAIRKRFPEITVIEAGGNLGFAGGNNLGIDAALKSGSDYILLLNNDTTVAHDLLSAFVETAEKYPDAAALSAKIYFYSDPKRLWHAGTTWNQINAAFEHVGQGMMDNGVDFERVRESDYACGCAMFLRASAVRALGKLDDRFFLLFEETDWSFRAKQAGFHCLVAPRARVWHRVSASLGGRGVPLFEYFFARNRLLWAQRHAPVTRRIAVWVNTLGTVYPAARLIDILGLLVTRRCGPRQAYWGLRESARQWRHDYGDPKARLLKRARRQGVLDYLAGRFGDCPGWIRTGA